MRGIEFDGNAFLKNVQDLFQEQQEKFSSMLDSRLEQQKMEILESFESREKSQMHGNYGDGFDGDHQDDRIISSENLFPRRTNSFCSSHYSPSISKSRSFPLTAAHLKVVSNMQGTGSDGSATPRRKTSSTFSTTSSSVGSTTTPSATGSSIGGCRSSGRESPAPTSGGVKTPVIISVLAELTPDTTHLAPAWTPLDDEYIKPLSEEAEKAMDSVDHIAKYATPDMVYMRFFKSYCFHVIYTLVQANIV
jgi:hypothetical protein